MELRVDPVVGIGLFAGSGLWARWVYFNPVSDGVCVAVLGVMVVFAVWVYLGWDSKEHGRWLGFGGYGAVLMISGVHVWLDGIVPVLSVGSFGGYSRYVSGLDGLGEALLAIPPAAFFVSVLLWGDVVVRSLGMGAKRDRRPRAESDLYGRSKFLSNKYMRLLSKRRGMLLGAWGAGRRAPLIGWALEGCALTVAPPRAGKGALIALNLLAPEMRGIEGSTVVIDPRGEFWCVAARRRRDLGRRVLLLDPFGQVKKHAREFDELYLPIVESARYNPLDFIREEEGLAVQDIGVLLDALLTEPGRSSQDVSQHFYQSARAVIAGYMAYVRFFEEPRDRHMGTVHRLLAMKSEEREQFVEDNAGLPRFAGGLFDLALQRQGQVGRAESGSIFSTIANQLQFLTFPELEWQTGATTFDPEWLIKGDTDLFVVVPDEHVGAVKGWLRLWITIPYAVASRRSLERDLWIIIDEMPTLGYLSPVMDGYNMAAGKGVHFWGFAQSLMALDQTWGVDSRKTLVQSAELVQVLGFPRVDGEGAEEMSKAIGSATFEAESESHSGSSPSGRVVGGGGQVQESDSRSLVRERLVTPDDLMRLGSDRQYVVAAGKDVPMDAMYLHRAKYWEHETAWWLADPNPIVLRGGKKNDERRG